MTRIRRGAMLVLAALLASAACGSDAPATPAKPKPAKKGDAKADAAAGGTAVKNGPKKKGKKKTQAALDVYLKIDEKYRRELTDADFHPDPSGEENRDPFRSYVVQQGVVNAEATQVAIQPTDICTEKNSKASGFLLRDLRLIGIVLKGTRSYAMFRDRGGLGWFAHRGDCLGKEKALVQSISVGSVSLQVIPETPPNSPPPPPQKQEIALYPEDMDPYEALANPSPTVDSTEGSTDQPVPPPP